MAFMGLLACIVSSTMAQVYALKIYWFHNIIQYFCSAAKSVDITNYIQRRSVLRVIYISQPYGVCLWSEH